MKTGEYLRVKQFGTNVMGVTLEGNPKKPEPVEFRVAFPGGDVTIARCQDGTYWAHIHVNRPADGNDPINRHHGEFIKSRIDAHEEGYPVDLASPDIYHVAVQIRPTVNPDYAL